MEGFKDKTIETNENPYPHLNELVNEWISKHSERYPNGVEINIISSPDKGTEIKIKEISLEE